MIAFIWLISFKCLLYVLRNVRARWRKNRKEKLNFIWIKSHYFALNSMKLRSSTVITTFLSLDLVNSWICFDLFRRIKRKKKVVFIAFLLAQVREKKAWKGEIKMDHPNHSTAYFLDFFHPKKHFFRHSLTLFLSLWINSNFGFIDQKVGRVIFCISHRIHNICYSKVESTI